MHAHILLLRGYLLPALMIAAVTAPAAAALYKCKDAGGAITYSDSPCLGKDIPLSKRGAVSSVNTPKRAFVPAYRESDSNGGTAVSSTSGATRSADTTQSSSGGSHY
ncbi:hypothetical protein IGB42_03434 [Andreprevotia sp. IGB-42]|uniref:DUF4124 domain-containing protein n=1 Tax=Andreprevotia sp. IGB-42 TaxID=2497473 RepID=UPI00135B578A|nr:hypothetical protein IGB42_03434 [Andreprevotia sp. IGB-42]